jgi:hypothetical protein
LDEKFLHGNSIVPWMVEAGKDEKSQERENRLCVKETVLGTLDFLFGSHGGENLP